MPDVPILQSDDDYYDFYHEYVSPALSQITKENTGLNTIGLFGPWGTGKSTIIENLKKEYPDLPIFVFDSWKYQGDPLRRTFLLKFFNFIQAEELWEQGHTLDQSFLDDFYEAVSEETTTPVTKLPNKTKKGLVQQIISWGITHKYQLVFGGTFLFLVTWTLAQYLFGENQTIISIGLKLVGVLGLSTTATAAFSILGSELVKHIVKKVLDSFDKEQETKKVIRAREYLNSPEQFEKKFLEIISSIKGKVVIVFDNIDRVQGDIAIEMLASIKTFLDPTEADKVIFVIPCDSDAIEEQVKKFYSGKSTDFNSSEYLRKLFNVIIWTPEFISTDLEDFTKTKLKSLGEDSNLLDNADLVLVINQAFKSNPREIKQFINNLVAALLVVSQTEVWNLVKDNIPYLAKTLVLKQKYPQAYKLLKEKWFEPENIIPDSEGELRNFMVNTNLITVTNAEPYIYYKLPNQAKGVVSSEELITALVSSDENNTKEIISRNKDKQTQLGEFISSTYTKYKSKPDWLSSIISTYLKSINELKISITDVDFLNKTADAIDRYIWQNYKSLPTKIVFSLIVANTQVKKVHRDQLIGRYIASIGSDELKKPENRAKTIEILESLKTVKLSNSQAQQCRKYIESGFGIEANIVGIFKELSEQKIFISKETIEKYLANINYENFPNLLPLLENYKESLFEHKLSDTFLATANQLLNQERAKSPADNEDKRTLISTLISLSVEPSSLLGGADAANISTLGTEVLTSYKQINNIDEKNYFIPLLLILTDYLDDAHATQASSYLSEFIKASSLDVLNQTLEELGSLNLSKKLANTLVSAFTERAISRDGSEIQAGFDLMESTAQQSVITAMINQRPDLGLSFIQSLSKLPDRPKTIEIMLNRLSQIPQLRSRLGYYDWIITNIKQKDTNQKTQLVGHIKSLLNSDQPESQEVGLSILQKAHFLSETYKREIADEAIEWLRTPGKAVNQNHEYLLNALAFIFPILQPTRKNDLVHILFELLDRQNERPILDTAIRVLTQIKPPFSEFESYFVDFKEKLGGWTNQESIDVVKLELVKLQSEKPTRAEKQYWNEVSQIGQE